MCFSKFKNLVFLVQNSLFPFLQWAITLLYIYNNFMWYSYLLFQGHRVYTSSSIIYTHLLLSTITVIISCTGSESQLNEQTVKVNALNPYSRRSLQQTENKKKKYSNFSLLQFLSLIFNQVKKNTFFLFSIIKYVNFIHFMKKKQWQQENKNRNKHFSLSLFVNLESCCIAWEANTTETRVWGSSEEAGEVGGGGGGRGGAGDRG